MAQVTFTFPGGAQTNAVLQEAIGAYSDEAYKQAKRLSGTGITSPNSDIVVDGETYSGQLRWRKNQDQVINTASITDSTPASLSSYDTTFLEYIKAVRTHGAKKVNLKSLITKDNELQKFSRELAITQAKDESDAIMSILKGIAIAEAMTGAAGLGGCTFASDPDSATTGFYVDLQTAAPVVAQSGSIQGAIRAEGFLNAFGQAWKDHEPEWAYLICTPEIIASLRSANLVDQDRVTDGQTEFNTIFQGKFRLIQTRATQNMLAGDRAWLNTQGGIDVTGTKTSFIVLPGSIAMEHLNIEEDVEIERDALAYKGGGTTTIIYRWGYVLHPNGYTWMGSKDAFPTVAQYSQVVESGTTKLLQSAASGLAGVTGVWKRKAASALSLGILPIFHG